KTNRSNFRTGEHSSCNSLQAQWGNTFAQRVIHRNTALHRSNRSEREQVRTVTGSVDTWDIGTRYAVDHDVTRRCGFHTDVLQAKLSRRRNRTNGHQSMRTVNLTTIGGLDYNAAIFGAGDGINAAVLFQLYAALCQNLFQYICSIGVIVRQNTITGSHHGDLHAQLSKGG